MKSFSKFLNEAKETLTEKALNIGNRSATPRFGQVVIAAGGAGSGKGFVLTNIVNIPNAKTFDVDELKKKVVGYNIAKIRSDYKAKYSKEITDINFKDPVDVSNLHAFVADNGWDDSVIDNFLKSKSGTSASNLPNVVFDCTFKKISKLGEISSKVQAAGYDKKNIHIVWILNNFQIAMQQNQERDRTVSTPIMYATHEGASVTMKELIQNFSKYSQYIDGDIWIVPNQQAIDNKFTVKQTYIDGKKKSLFKLEQYAAIQIKAAGKPCRSYDSVAQEILAKVNSYVPQNGQW